MAEVEPVSLVDDLEEAPDVLDVGVAEGEVVLAPVHPLPQADGAAREFLGRLDDDLPAAARELFEPVLLDLALRVQPKLPLDADLDPQALAVEAVLVALVEAAECLVALEDVLERAAPRGVYAEGLVGGHRAVEEAPPRPAAVQLPDLVEDPPFLPPGKDFLLECRVIRDLGQAAEHAQVSLRFAPG